MSNEPKKPLAYVDAAALSEDARIQLCGTFVMDHRKSAWCLTDDEPDKPERYLRKMKQWFPLLRFGEIKRGFPTPGSAGFTVHPPQFS